MKIILAPDSFKGSMTALAAAEAMEQGVLKAAQANKVKIQAVKIPMADGGEGTVAAIIAATGGQVLPTRVLDPLGREIDSFYGILPDRTGVIEMAAASGLNLIKTEERNPCLTTTYGTGQLIKAAVEAGCRRIVIGIGGSATNDGGVGMAQAIGVSFKDQSGQELGLGGGKLDQLTRIDDSGLDPRIRSIQFIVASDVKNVLCGREGAAAVYGPQKGATPEMVARLDQNLNYLAELMKRDLGKAVAELPGAGAAGGLGAGLLAFLGAKLQPGIEIIMQVTDFEKQVRQADLVLTGEGSTDYQTLYGKVPFGVAEVARKWRKPVICISGGLGEGYQKLYSTGINAFFSITNGPIDLADAMQKGGELLEGAVENIIRTYLIKGAK